MAVDNQGKTRILVADDDTEVLRFLVRALGLLGHEVLTATSGEEAVAVYGSERPDLLLTDLKMPGFDGLKVIELVIEMDPEATIVVITAHATINSAVQSVRLGASDYLTKPIDLDHLEVVLQKSLRSMEISRRLRVLEDQLVSGSSFEGIVGVCSSMRSVYDRIRRFAGSDVTVLVEGETGTGKELVARAIHNLSPRSTRACVPINCGALPESLLESELFGHERGAFTGAVKRKYGLIEQANGGTLFLDEIEEMSPALQVKLLRALQEHEVLRVGGDGPIKVDFRLIAASNVDLQAMMASGDFRPDLFYRLGATTIRLPPLRDRGHDIGLLARHFVELYSEREGASVTRIAPDALMALRAYSWPGNVRELQHVIEQAVILTRHDTIQVKDLPEQLRLSEPSTGLTDDLSGSLKDARERFERSYLVRALEISDGNVTRAAKLAGISRQHFHEKIQTLGVRSEGAGGPNTEE